MFPTFGLNPPDWAILSDINGVGCIKLLSDLYSLIKIYYFFKNDNVMGGGGRENGS